MPLNQLTQPAPYPGEYSILRIIPLLTSMSRLADLKAILKTYLFEAKTNTKPVYMYHASDNANLQEPLTGTYSQKFEQDGMFVAPMSAMRNSWAAYTSGKTRFTPKNKREVSGQEEGQRFNKLTLYKLSMPKWVFDQADKAHHDRANQAMEQSGINGLGAWGWDIETFIPADLLKYVHIVGRKTGNPREFMTGNTNSQKYAAGQKNIHRADYEYDEATGKFKKKVQTYGPPKASLEAILKARDDSMKLLDHEELVRVVKELEFFLSPKWIEAQIKVYDARRKNSPFGHMGYTADLRSSQEKYAKEEREKNRETAERKLALAKSLL